MSDNSRLTLRGRRPSGSRVWETMEHEHEHDAHADLFDGEPKADPSAAERDSNVSDLVREAVDRLIASDGIDGGVRFDAFREKIEAGPEFTEEDLEAADAEVKATHKRRRAARV